MKIIGSLFKDQESNDIATVDRKKIITYVNKTLNCSYVFSSFLDYLIEKMRNSGASFTALNEGISMNVAKIEHSDVDKKAKKKLSY